MPSTTTLLLEMLNEIERLNIENCKLRILWRSFPMYESEHSLDAQLEEMPLTWDMPQDVHSQFVSVREHIHREKVADAAIALHQALDAVKRLH